MERDRASRRGPGCLLAVAVIFTLHIANAGANPEFQMSFDARSAAMGGTGVSHVDSGAAVALNPAALAGEREVAVTVAVSPFFLRPSGPFADMGPSREGELVQVPLFFAGGGWRATERLAVGAGIYATTGAGAEFQDVPELGGQGAELNVAVMEAALPVAYHLGRLSIGGALRFGFVSQSNDMVVVMGSQASRVQQDLSGFDLVPGVTLGGHYRLGSDIALGLVYRSKLTMDFSGTTTMDNMGMPIEAETETSWSIPHSVRAGATFRGLDRRLLVAAEAALTFFGEANETQEQMLKSGPVEFVLSVPLNWQTAAQGKLGAEYALRRSVALRAGYSIGNSATPAHAATVFAPAPGIMQGISAGAGVLLGDFTIDLAAAMFLLGSDVDETEDPALAGRYDATASLLSVAASYRR
jgi:long-subunit fatty acid transport protein